MCIPLRNSPQCGSHIGRTPSSHRREMGQCHSTGSCDPGTSLPPSRDVVHRAVQQRQHHYVQLKGSEFPLPCFFFRLFQRRIWCPFYISHSQEDGRGYTWSTRMIINKTISGQNLGLTLCLSRHFLLLTYLRQNSQM